MRRLLAFITSLLVALNFIGVMLYLQQMIMLLYV